ncbi:hypothetical protein EPUL_005559, partial [Erysiphe pulchra]
MELLGIDFIGPFPKFDGIKTFYILVAVDYFSRFVWSKATVTDNSDSVTSFLENIFLEHGIPIGIYADSGAHFGKATQKFAELYGVVWCTSPVSAKKATGMRALKKNVRDPSQWPSALAKSTFDINRRDILHLGYSPYEILKGFVPNDSLEAKFPTSRRESLRTSLSGGLSNHTYSPGQLVMLWDEKSAGMKLRPAWRGPFIVTGFGGDMGKSYTIRQIDGSIIPRHYYGDHLKPFRLREGYLITQEEEKIPVYQNIRLGNAAFKLPRSVRKVPGVHTSLNQSR